MLAAVADGTLSQQVVEEIRVGKTSISRVAKALKGKTGDKPKASGWRTHFRAFSKAIRLVVKRDPRRRAEVAAELRRLADEFELNEKAAA